MVVQKYIVLLGERDGKQIWLAYDIGGRLGNASYEQAYRYDTWKQACDALCRVRFTGARWPRAQILGTTVDSPEGKE